MEAAFDTLAYTRRLKAAGFSEEQAEAQTEALHVAFREGAAARGEVATKADLETTKADLEASIAALEVRMTNRLHAAVFAGFALNAGLVIAVVKLL